MKARIPPKHRLTKEILDVAVREAKRQADEQIDDVCKRCTNEFMWRCTKPVFHRKPSRRSALF